MATTRHLSGFTWALIGAAMMFFALMAFLGRSWLPMLKGIPVTSTTQAAAAEEQHAEGPPPEIVQLSAQARKNLGLVAKPVKLQSYWRTLSVPGVIIDRPGLSDRGVTSPAVGVVTEIHAYPGDTVRPGERLFTLKLFSEYLQNTQSSLFQATKEVQLIQEQYDRLAGPARSGAIAESRLIEVENQLKRQKTQIQAHRQDLLTRGLTPAQIDEVAQGNFVTEIEVVAPPAPAVAEAGSSPVTSEVQELKVDLGQQVQAGQVLSMLANHTALYIEGHAFKQEAPLIARAAAEYWPVAVEFAEDDRGKWPELNQQLAVRHLSNSINPDSRTFNFFIPLENQSRQYRQAGRDYYVWRFRPGQRVRLAVPVEEVKDVLVLPSAAVVREGPEAYVFRQNGDLFNRLPVHVLYEDRQHVVVSPEGKMVPGIYIAQSGAATLNRVLKSQAASGLPVGGHYHADGSYHAAGSH